MFRLARFGVLAVFVVFAAAAIAVAGTTTTLADSQRSHFRTILTGYQETPTLNSAGHGTLAFTISDDNTRINYTLSYDGLTTTTNSVLQAHVHFGARAIAGGISAWLCGTSGLPGPTGTPTCPASGSVSGTITASSVVGPAGQGISPGDFAALLRAIRHGVTYANVHTTAHPSGEIRGQIDGRLGADKQDD